MNPAHVHLLINHLPILGSILGGFVLAQGLWTKSSHTKIAAYSLFIISSLGAVIAYFTGEGAEEAVENIQGVSKAAIDQHEGFASIALIALIILGAVSIIGFFLTMRKSSLENITAVAILFISLLSFGLVARTGYLGGKIRHAEISYSSTNPGQNAEGEKKEDDD